MDANCHMGKTDLLQAMTRAGWVDVAGGLGDTYMIGFHEKQGEDTIEWTQKGEEQFGYDLAACNTEVREEQVKGTNPEWTYDSLIEAGYAEIV